MIPAAFAIPGDIATPTGGYRYDREVMARMAGHGVAMAHLPLPGSFPFPSAEDLAETAAALGKAPAGTVLVIDGLAYGALPESLCAGIANPIVALVHHPLALESGLAAETAARLRLSEKAALRHASAVVVTSPATRRLLADDFAIPADAIRVAEPGTERAPRASGSGSPTLHLLAVGALSPRKGYPVLAEALAGLAGMDWRLTIAGATDRNPEAFADARAAFARFGLATRVTFAGSVSEDELAALYARADLFVMPSLYEGYGMVLAEAMARGIAIVATTGGAAAETVPDAAALKVPPGEAAALAAALDRALGNADLRRRLAEASWAAGRQLPTWDDTAGIIAEVIRDVAARGATRKGRP